MTSPVRREKIDLGREAGLMLGTGERANGAWAARSSWEVKLSRMPSTDARVPPEGAELMKLSVQIRRAFSYR